MPSTTSAGNTFCWLASAASHVRRWTPRIFYNSPAMLFMWKANQEWQCTSIETHFDWKTFSRTIYMPHHRAGFRLIFQNERLFAASYRNGIADRLARKQMEPVKIEMYFCRNVQNFENASHEQTLKSVSDIMRWYCCELLLSASSEKVDRQKIRPVQWMKNSSPK
jgi:hypothetical protein